MQASITKAPPFAGKGAQPLAELSVIAARGDIAVGLRRMPMSAQAQRCE
jgi:hypothetical protein